MLYQLVTIIVLLFTLITHAQPSINIPADSLNKKRFVGVTTGIGTVWVGSIIGLSQVWYKDVESTKWHTFNDSGNWLQMDKMGHFYTAHKINQLSTDLYRWTGYNRRKSLWIGTGISLGYQTTIEMFDAYTVEWGFSWGDMLANVLGTSSYLSQELIWHEERIIPKFSYAPTKFASIRPEVLGNTFAQSLLKDYNGQSYWLSASPGTFFKESSFPKWLCFSFGYGANQKLVGSESSYIDPKTGIEYNEQREFLFSLDVDFSRIPIKRKWLKILVKQLNYLKVPFPTLIVRDGKLKGSILGY